MVFLPFRRVNIGFVLPIDSLSAERFLDIRVVSNVGDGKLLDTIRDGAPAAGDDGEMFGGIGSEFSEARSSSVARDSSLSSSTSNNGDSVLVRILPPVADTAAPNKLPLMTEGPTGRGEETFQGEYPGYPGLCGLRIESSDRS